jgi:hypothetical protein
VQYVAPVQTSAHCACILSENAVQRAFPPSLNAFPTNTPTFQPSLAPSASPTPVPTTVFITTITTEPTRAFDAIATTTTPPTSDSLTPFTPTAPPVDIPGLEEETPNGGAGTTKARGGFGPGAGTALGAGLLVLFGGVFILRRKGKKDVEADATTAPPTDLEGGSSA